MRSRTVLRACLAVAATSLASSCSTESREPSTPTLLTRDQLLDSAACGGCHREHYAEWAGSMHAYAADDPVFRALNQRMQREVSPEQRGFCLKCHAPIAERMGITDLAAIDARPELKGVSCFFCHAMVDSRGTHNNPLILDEENVVLGGAIRDPMDPVVHKAEYRTWLDGTQENQSGMCGPCHDIVALGGAHIERTFREWSLSSYGVGGRTKTSCAAATCHMPERDGPAAVVAGAPTRKLHDHAMVGVDLALTPFPDKEIQRAKTQALLDDAIEARLCVESNATGALVDVALTNTKVGHAWPSGSNQDRRAWLSLVAFAGGKTIFETGAISDDVAVERARDPKLFLLRDYDFEADGTETHLFWRAATFESKQIPAPTFTNPNAHSVHARFELGAVPDRVTMALKIRPIDYDLVDDLVASGDLDRRALDPIVTFTLAKTKLEWSAGVGKPCTP